MIEQLKGIVSEAGDLLLHHFAQLTKADISVKELGGLVTKADMAAEAFLIDRLKKLRPDAGFLAEESGISATSATSTAQHGRWIIDPLDGTSNFANRIPWFCISVAFEATVGKEDFETGVVYHPFLREMFHAVKGQGAFLNDKPIRVSEKTALPYAMLGTGFYYHKGEDLSKAMRIFADMQEHVLAVRRFGAAALDLAYVAAGRFDGFWEVGLAPWDMAAGVLLIREAGGVMSDYSNQPHSIYNSQTVAGNTAMHRHLVSIINK